MKRLNIILLLIAGILSLSGCMDDPEGEAGIINSQAPVMGDIKQGTVTASYIEVTATVEKMNGLPLERFGIEWIIKGSQEVTGRDSKTSLTGDEEDKVFQYTISDIKPDTIYYVYAYAENSKGRSFSDTIQVSTTPGIGRVRTVEPYNITATSALSGGEITVAGEGENLLWGVFYSLKADMSERDTLTAREVITGNNFLVELTGLQPDTIYYVQAFVRNQFGYFGSEDKETLQFRTNNGKPKLEETIQIEWDHTTAVITAVILDKGDADIEERGICISDVNTIPAYGSDSAIVAQGTTTGTFRVEIKDLQPEQLYFIRAYAKNRFGVGYSTDENITLSEKPAVITTEPSVEDRGSVRVGGQVQNRGKSDLVVAGICWSGTNREPTIENSDTVHLAYDMDPYETVLAKIKGGTTYYIRAFAQNETSVGYGEVKMLITPDLFERMASSPVASYRYQSSSGYISAKGKGYLLGGDLGNVYSNTFWEYDPDANEWIGKMNFPAYRKGQAIAYREQSGHFVVFGGMQVTNTLTGDVYLYGLNNIWDLHDASPAASPLHSAVGVGSADGDNTYFIGGNRSIGGVDDIVDETWVYQYYAGNMVAKTPLPQPQFGGIAVIINGVIYAGLGFTDAMGTRNHTNLWSSGDGMNSWTNEVSFPGTAVVRSGVAHDSLIYVLDDDGVLWTYSPGSRIWNKRSKILISNSYPDYMWSLGDYIYIGFGGNNKTLLRYDPLWDN